MRWGIGAIINGDPARAVAREAGSKQKAGAVALEQARVRSTCALRRDMEGEETGDGGERADRGGAAQLPGPRNWSSGTCLKRTIMTNTNDL